jgi:hypothetical protein
MFPTKMKAGDLTCLLCGSSLELKLDQLKIGKNTGSCPMCGEPFSMKFHKDDMESFKEAEKKK